ncbi:MAG: hypothetical protein AB8H12_09915 [Lewinella sp.]
MKNPPSFLLLLSLLFLASGALMAQTEAEEAVPLRRLGVHVMPLSLLQIRPRIRFGITSTKGRKAKSLDVEISGPASAISYGGACPTGLPILSFYGIQPEVKWFKKKRPYDGGFIALTGVINFSNSNVNDLVFVSDEGYFDTTQQHDFRLAAIAKVGHLLRMEKKGFIEFYLGVGGGIRRFSYHTFGPMVSEDEAFAQCGESAFRGVRTDLRPEFQLGVKLGLWVK